MIRHSLAFVLLTITTQVGGVAWLCALFARRFGRFSLVFLVLYIGFSIGARHAAPLVGRVALPCLDAGPAQIAVLNPLYCVLNRNYVTPDMNDHADQLAAHMHQAFPGTRTRALDANFPFFEGFPLLPHLSHDDGRKLDLAYYYTDEMGEYQTAKARWFLGYWAFEQPRPGDPEPCGDQPGVTLRWNMAWLQDYVRDWPIDEIRTTEALRWLSRNPAGPNTKILIEPHLAKRLGAAGSNVRFQGCRAARHDDHIHIQF
jgi:hypothetical protein